MTGRAGDTTQRVLESATLLRYHAKNKVKRTCFIHA
jgi:hypothetical protein